MLTGNRPEQEAPCEKCGAGIGQPCRDANGTVASQSHAARVREWHEFYRPLQVRWRYPC